MKLLVRRHMPYFIISWSICNWCWLVLPFWYTPPTQMCWESHTMTSALHLYSSCVLYICFNACLSSLVLHHHALGSSAFNFANFICVTSRWSFPEWLLYKTTTPQYNPSVFYLTYPILIILILLWSQYKQLSHFFQSRVYCRGISSEASLRTRPIFLDVHLHTEKYFPHKRGLVYKTTQGQSPEHLVHAFMVSHDDIEQPHIQATDLHVIAELLESTVVQKTVEWEMKNATVLLGHGRNHTWSKPQEGSNILQMHNYSDEWATNMIVYQCCFSWGLPHEKMSETSIKIISTKWRGI